MSLVNLVKVILIGYVLGSIPFGYYMGKMYGVDVKKQGSGNIGFTNVWRLTSPAPALIVLFFDAAKGWLAIYYGYSVGGEKLALAGAIASILGHMFTFLLNFKGGKGVATGFGICIYIDPMMTIIAVLIFLIVVYFTKYVSLASISAAITVTTLSLLFNLNIYYKLIIIPASIMVIIMHRENIKRIIQGTENKIDQKEV